MKDVNRRRSSRQATDIVDEMEGVLGEELKKGRVTVATAILHCVQRHDELQGRVVKTFRRLFNASKVSDAYEDLRDEIVNLS